MAPPATTSAADPVTGSPVFPIGSTINAAGHLEIGGCDAVELAREFGTPAYVYAPDDIRARARSYRDAFRARGVEHEVVYASKAAPVSAIYRLCEEEGLSVDVASGGELHAALAAGFRRSGSTCTATTSQPPSSSSRSIARSAASSSTPSTRSSSPTRCWIG